MTASDLPYALYGLLNVALFLAWFHFCWQRFAIDLGRDQLLEVRNCWFDTVISKPQWCDNAACRRFLVALEAQSRWIHKCSVPMIVLMLCVPRASRRWASQSVDAAIRKLPNTELRLRARGLQDQSALIIGRTTVMRSLVALALVVVLLPIVLVGALVVERLSRGQSEVASKPGEGARWGWARSVRGVSLWALRPVSEMEWDRIFSEGVVVVGRFPRAT